MTVNLDGFRPTCTSRDCLGFCLPVLPSFQPTKFTCLPLPFCPPPTRAAYLILLKLNYSNTHPLTKHTSTSCTTKTPVMELLFVLPFQRQLWVHKVFSAFPLFDIGNFSISPVRQQPLPFGTPICAPTPVTALKSTRFFRHFPSSTHRQFQHFPSFKHIRGMPKF